MLNPLKAATHDDFDDDTTAKRKAMRKAAEREADKHVLFFLKSHVIYNFWVPFILSAIFAVFLYVIFHSMISFWFHDQLSDYRQ